MRETLLYEFCGQTYESSCVARLQVKNGPYRANYVNRGLTLTR